MTQAVRSADTAAAAAQAVADAKAAELRAAEEAAGGGTARPGPYLVTRTLGIMRSGSLLATVAAAAAIAPPTGGR